MKNKQISLKPQDVFLMLKLASNPSSRFTYSSLSEALGIAVSEAHAAVGRCVQSRLLTKGDAGFDLARKVFADFLIFGAAYFFPPVTGSSTRGLPTGYAAPPLNEVISQPKELPPVWPDPHGEVRGIALYPLYPSVPKAAENDVVLYENLALFDALRSGAAREREIAQKLLRERL